MGELFRGFALSDEWFFDKGSVRKSSRSWVSILVIVLVIVNVGVIAYFTTNFNLNMTNLNNEIAGLNLEVESLQFQVQSANYEISALKDSIKVQNLGNGSSGLELTQIYNQTRRSVVLITVRTSYGGGQGSGFVFDGEGRIITNNHVVEEAEEITVTFIDGTNVPATLVGTDPYVDLAVIDVDIDVEIAAYLLKPITLGSSSELLVGERVIALGNPFGLADTMTVGIVSAVGRQMDAPGGYTIVDVIQTDAAINPGNSGGPLLNMKGEVVGMNTAILSGTGQFSGIGFAIPSDTIAKEVPSLIESGVYEHPYLGIRGMGLTPALKEAMDLDETTQGALVSEVVDGGPADEAGLKGGTREETVDGVRMMIGGDIIIGVGSRTVKNFYDLVVFLERYQKPGDIIVLTIIRDNQVIEIELELGIRPEA